MQNVVALGVFWLSTILLFYGYIGYPLLVWWVGRSIFPRPTSNRRSLGGTIMLIAAHNEEGIIEEKIENSLLLDPGTTEVVVVSDGSTDRTDALVEAFVGRNPRVRLIRIEEQSGKNHALNCALRVLEPSPDTVVVFTDANAMYEQDAVRQLRSGLESGAACVVGKLVFTNAVTGTAQAEGLYWRYENALKTAEGAIGRLPFANGAIFAIQACDIGKLPLDIGNDFWIPVTVLGSRKRVIYDPLAIAHEPAPNEGREEFARKVRMANRQTRGVLTAWAQIDPATRFQLISHKVIRWLGLPLLACAIISGAILWPMHPFYRIALLILVLPFLLGTIGFMARGIGYRIPVADVAAHFILVQVAALFGLVEGLIGRRRTTWSIAASTRRT